MGDRLQRHHWSVEGRSCRGTFDGDISGVDDRHPGGEKLASGVESHRPDAHQPDGRIDERIRWPVERRLGHRGLEAVAAVVEYEEPFFGRIPKALHHAPHSDPQAIIRAAEEPVPIDGPWLGLGALAEDADANGRDVRGITAAVGPPMDFDLQAGSEPGEHAGIDLRKTALLGLRGSVDPDAARIILHDEAIRSTPRHDTPHRHQPAGGGIDVGEHVADRHERRECWNIVTSPGTRNRQPARHSQHQKHEPRRYEKHRSTHGVTSSSGRSHGLLRVLLTSLTRPVKAPLRHRLRRSA